MIVARYEVHDSSKKKFRPVGNGMIGSARAFCDLGRGIDRVAQLTPYPTGRFLFVDTFQAVNCLATINSPSGTTSGDSPRDKVRQLPSGQLPGKSLRDDFGPQGEKHSVRN